MTALRGSLQARENPVGIQSSSSKRSCPRKSTCVSHTGNVRPDCHEERPRPTRSPQSERGPSSRTGGCGFHALWRRIGARILHGLREALPPTIFFFVGFNFVVVTTRIFSVANYAVAVSNFMLATVAALIVGKAVITANAMPFLKLFDRAP